MKKLVSVITILTLSIFLVSCGGGSSSSGTSLDLTGLWRLYPQVTDSTVQYVPINVLLQQSGNKVVSTRFIEELPAGAVPCSPPASPIVSSLTGTASGNTLNGTVTASAWNATFSVSGDSSLLTGTFQIHYHSGICSSVGTDIGRITFSKF